MEPCGTGCVFRLVSSAFSEKVFRECTGWLFTKLYQTIRKGGKVWVRVPSQVIEVLKNLPPYIEKQTKKGVLVVEIDPQVEEVNCKSGVLEVLSQYQKTPKKVLWPRPKSYY